MSPGESTSDGGLLPGWIPTSEPDWWSTVSDFGSDPTGFILGKVRLWLVGGVITVIEVVTGRVLWFWSIVSDAVDAGGDSIDFAFGDAGTVLIDALSVFPELLRGLGADLGPFAGVIVSIGGVLLLWVLWQAIEETPGIVWKLYQLIPGT